MENSERSSRNDVHNPSEINHLHPAVPFTASDLPIDDEGRIYHIQIKPGQIAPDILIVGDPGFSAPQGRDTARVKPSVLELDKFFSEFDPMIDDQRIENMEMEASFLIHFLGGMGYWAGAICPAIANRRQDTIDVHYQEAIENATKVALLALATMRNRYPDVRIS